VFLGSPLCLDSANFIFTFYVRVQTISICSSWSPYWLVSILHRK